MNTSIDIKYEGRILIATYDNPRSELNLIDEQAHEDWLEFVQFLKRLEDADVIVIKGTPNAFTGGGDIAMFDRLANDEIKIDRLRRDARQLVWDYISIDQPIIFAGRGASVGLGATFALLSDFIIMGETARIIDPHVKVGLAAGDGGTAIWSLVMGPILAKKYLMTGAPLSAQDGLALGVVTEVCPDALVVERTMQMAMELASLPSLAVRYTKIAINANIRRALIDSFDLSSALETVNFFTNQHRQAVSNFGTKTNAGT